MANHGKRRDSPEPTPQPLPPVEWLTLVRVDDGDYRVLRLVTEGVPVEAEIGEPSADHHEGEERYKVAAADLFDRVANATLPERAKPADPNPAIEAAAHNRALDAAIAALRNLRKVTP